MGSASSPHTEHDLWKVSIYLFAVCQPCELPYATTHRRKRCQPCFPLQGWGCCLNAGQPGLSKGRGSPAIALQRKELT